VFYVYILHSARLEKYYVSQTNNLHQRVAKPNSGISSYTSRANDYAESFTERSAVIQREREIKKEKSKKYIGWLISSAGPDSNQDATMAL
jgi:putative endonuclease